jgi:hypothetical protein
LPVRFLQKPPRLHQGERPTGQRASSPLLLEEAPGLLYGNLKQQTPFASRTPRHRKILAREVLTAAPFPGQLAPTFGLGHAPARGCCAGKQAIGRSCHHATTNTLAPPRGPAGKARLPFQSEAAHHVANVVTVIRPQAPIPYHYVLRTFYNIARGRSTKVSGSLGYLLLLPPASNHQRHWRY